MWDLSTSTRDRTCIPCTRRLRLNHWTTREDLRATFNIESASAISRHLDSPGGEGKGTPLQCSCLENPMDGGAWWAAVYGVAQSQTRLKRLSSSSRLSWGFLGGASGKESACRCRRCKRPRFDLGDQEDPLEEGMATQSSVHAWRIPWTEGPGGLPSIGSQRVRHD